MRKNGLAHGMTLLEAMIALTVVAVGMLALVSSIISSMIVQDSSRMETLATNWARSKLNELEQNQALTSSFQNVFSAYTGQVPPNNKLNHAMRTPQPWIVPNAWGEDLTAYDAATGLPSAPNAVYIPDPIQTLTAGGQVKTLFIGWYFIYFPTNAAGHLSASDTGPAATPGFGTGTNSYYGNPKMPINLDLMGMSSTTAANNVDIFGVGNGTPPSPSAANDSAYVLLPVTVRVIWQDPHTGDPRNDYMRYVEVHGMLGEMRENDPLP
jgi:type II secretory pathway pseudopilin PulG